MIVQCEACQTRFRLADEKVKPGGTKVRCSKCKEVFIVTPPEPEAVEETVDFGSFNMEKVSEDDSSATTAAEAEPQPEVPPATDRQPSQDEEPDNVADSSAKPESGELDFSSLEAELGSSAGSDEELADDFAFVDTSQSAADDADEVAAASAAGATSPTPAEAPEQQHATRETDSAPDLTGSEDTEGPFEFEFSDDQATTAAGASPATEDSAGDAAGPVEFAFDDEQDEKAFSFDDTEEETTAEENDPADQAGEFSFDDESPFDSEAASEWDDEPAADTDSFDFEDPRFDIDEASKPGAADDSAETSLQFGELDFAVDKDDSESQGSQPGEGFISAAMKLQEEPEPFRPSQPSPSHDYDDEESLKASLPAKKSSLSRILVLLILLLVALGGAAGFLYMQEGSLNLSSVTQYLPFLKDYIDETPATSPTDSIGINISGSSYVNGKAGQLLVVQGTIVNNQPTTRSAIAIKGVLLNAQGQPLMQQTVFCGNRLVEATLKTMSFAAIEEVMNNQFGDSLSNMNVAVGASIPFTIVFRNLPAGVANINVEVVDSKPGAG